MAAVLPLLLVTLLLMLWDEHQGQCGINEGRQEKRQKPLARAPVSDRIARNCGEGHGATRVTPTVNAHSVIASCDRYLDRLIHRDRPGCVAVEFNLIWRAPNLEHDCLVRQPQCCHDRWSLATQYFWYPVYAPGP